jgi:hypothetical protein
MEVALAPRSLQSSKARFWVETIALASVIACALALAIAILGFLAGAAAAGSESLQSSAGQANQISSTQILSTQALHQSPSPRGHDRKDDQRNKLRLPCILTPTERDAYRMCA